MLQSDALTASEVSYKVGFSSVSYFTKCFREHYGYPPGEEIKRFAKSAKEPTKVEQKPNRSPNKNWITAVVVFSALILIAIFYPKKEPSKPFSLEKSIAVLPFKNDSDDSSNVYIINGLMEAILNNLQKIEDLRVISRTSVEQYRASNKSIAQISKELDVNYILEGSGQKVGDQILLTIQLIEAPKDDHLWSQRYNRNTNNIFELQAEVAKDIAKEIQAYISAEEITRIEKVLTNNTEAYDLYLRGLYLINKGFGMGIEEALGYFQLSVKEDPDFALGHAYIALCYYYADIFQAKKQYGKEINESADRALYLDPELFMSQIAKGLFYMHVGQYELAAQYFEKALEYNPNSASANNFMSEIYTNFLPNTTKYLQHALRVIRLDKSSADSTIISYSFLHLSNALAQTGFFDEAEVYIKESIGFDSTNLFSQYLYAYVKLAQGNDYPETVRLLKEVLAKDTTRLDVMIEVAKMQYTMEAYEEASSMYDVYNKSKEQNNLNIFDGEEIKIAFVLDQIGRSAEAKRHLETYRIFAENDQSIYRDMIFSGYYAYLGDIEKGIEYLKKFSEQRDYFYWLVMMMEDDPILKRMSGHPDYAPTVKKIKDQFWESHRSTRKMLEKEGLLQNRSLKKASSY